MIITELERNNLIADMTELLEEYDYCYEIDALETIIDEWVHQKATLIEAFKKHPNYIEGKFMIAFDKDYSREVDLRQTRGFQYTIDHWASNYRDDIPEYLKEIRKKEGCTWLPDTLYKILRGEYPYYYERTITDKMAFEINEVCPDIHAHSGQKTSRVINKICCYLGYNKDPDYNREFARFADAISPLTITRHTVLSLNPLDYLTMSFGNSWASCHTIDKTNRRGMPNNYSGCYSSGTVSYMLDPSSMVFYTVDSSYDGTDYWDQPKINRQMYHYGEDKLVQGRLYPQDNDGATHKYEKYRNIVQEIISTIFEFPNLWTLSKGTEAASRYIATRGTHYDDYNHYGNCTLSKIKDVLNDKHFIVGAKPICIECGERHTTQQSINCCHSSLYRCSCCGANIDDEDDAIYIDDEIYCTDCTRYCDCCDEWYLESQGAYIPSQNRYACNDCLNEYYEYCDCCDEYVDRDCITYVESSDLCVCEDCFERYYAFCDHCGEAFRIEDLKSTSHGKLCSGCMATMCTENEENEEDNEDA